MAPFDTSVSDLVPIAVVIPILVACLLLAVGRLLPRVILDLVAFLTAVGVVVCTSILLVHSEHGRVVRWAAGWRPQHGFSVGIVLVADPVGAGIATLAAGLVVLGLIYSWRYFDSAEARYHCLVLLFLAGMVGFALTGDLFDMFVFFELMGATAYALTGFKIEDPTSVHGALNFGIINSLGAYVSLMGVGLLYARVGNLTLPELHVALTHHRPDALLVAAFVAVMTGFLVKGAMVPFHFWLADAHAVAPTPVCVLFSGVMVPLGIYAAFRVYWLVFSPVIPIGDLRRAFIVLGTLTAIVGALMCFAQRHLKRLLAYSTIAHVGLFLIAAGCLTEAGTAGAILYVVGHAAVKSALFLIAGTILNRYGSVDEVELFGRGRDARVVRWLAVAGGLALAGAPPFGTGLGKAIAEEAGTGAGYHWIPAVFIVTSALTGGAVMRAVTRIYFGLGRRPGDTPDPEQTRGEEEPETRVPLPRLRWTMSLPIVILLAAAFVMGLVPRSRYVADQAAAVFIDAGGYARAALAGTAGYPRVPVVPNWTWLGLGFGVLSTLLAVGAAAAALYGPRWAAVRGLARQGLPALTALRRIHSGHIGDYVTWLMAGMAVLGALVGLPLT